MSLKRFRIAKNLSGYLSATGSAYISISLLSYSCVVSDMQLRVSLWCSVKDIGWPLPPREPLTKAELIEEERMREAMLEARRNATFEDQQLPCRSVRVLVGFKP